MHTIQELIIDKNKMLSFINENKNSYFIFLKQTEIGKNFLKSLNGKTLQEKLYNFCFSINETPKCEHCKQKEVTLKDKSFFKGYIKFCSKSCATSSMQFQQKYKSTCIQKFGGVSPRASKEVASKYMKTWLENEEKNRVSIANAKIKRIATCQEKYGENNILSVKAIQELAHKSCSKTMHSYREYISTNGNVYKVRGFEDKAIEILELKGSKFIADDFATPTISYQLNNKNKKYYPDIFVPEDNLIVEVKALYWLKKQPEKNMAIMKQVLSDGFNFEFWIFIGKNRIIVNTIEDLKGILE